MKKNCLLLAVLGLLLIASCSTYHISREKMLSQDQFPMTKLDDSTYSITVNYYDTASAYDSPYQKFMLDNSNKPDGHFVVKDEHGITRRTLSYKNHLRNGKDTWYYANGNIMQEKNFVNNHYTYYRTYYPNRNLIEYELADTLGYKRRWDEMGNLIYEKNYVTGEFKQWDSNGKLRIKGMECPGECYTMQGPWYYYTEAGKLDQIVFYHGSEDPTQWDSIYHYQGNKITFVERK